MRRGLLSMSLLLVLLIPFVTTRSEDNSTPQSKEFVEDYSKRGQTYRHWYNESSGEYRYSSDYLVYKTGVATGSDWVTLEEYPNRFIIRLTDGSIRTFETPEDISNYISLINNNTIWAVGYESFSGVFGFYLNFADTDWGHAQYLYWPRLKNGQITEFNRPLYAIFPHLYVKTSGVWHNKILNDRSLYRVDSDPRNNLHFFDENESGIYFTTNNINLLSSDWDIVQGFKYNKTSTMYHITTELRCNNRIFDDIGMAYEITSTSQSDGTPFQPEYFTLINETFELTVNISQAWEAGVYLEDFYSIVAITSKNGESFRFIFDDMEQAGFTEKYLNLHNQQMPDGRIRKVLRVGMYGYGSYNKGDWIKIDPTFSGRQVFDDYDFCGRYMSPDYLAFTVSNYANQGYWTGPEQINRGSIAWDTGLTALIITTSNAEIYFRLHATYSETLEADEYILFGLYDKEDADELWDEVEALADPEGWFTQELYWENASYWSPDVSLGYDSTLNADELIDAWVSHHNGDPSGRQFIPLAIREGAGCDPNTQDRAVFYESTWTTPLQRPLLTFTYTIVGDEEEAEVVAEEEHDPIIQEPPVWFTLEFALYIWMVIWLAAGIIVSGLVLYWFFKQLLSFI